jgi:GTP-binding protein
MAKPIVAIVGRPNVGKSTLFNRLVGQPLAIVEGSPGTTRDRLYANAEWSGKEFVVVDTGGLDLASTDDLVSRIRAQAEEAIAEADVVVLVTDVADGVTAGDHEVVAVLRRSRKPVLLAVNKAENPKRRELDALEFYELGLGDPLVISAIHGIGIGDLLDAVVGAFASLPTQAEEDVAAIKIAIVGRPNVGKSSLLNTLLGWERAIVSPIPGTTRDALDTPMIWDGKQINLIDTAGIRRRGRVAPGVEKYSVLRSLRAIGRADVVLLLLDALEGITEQDAHVASYILDEYKSVVVVVNKWDLYAKDSRTQEEFTNYVRQGLRFMPYVPVVFASALTGKGVGTVMETALSVYAGRRQRISTGKINEIIRQAVAEHAPPSKWGKRLTFYYGTQPETDPPTLVFFVNDVRLVHFGYERYLENCIRAQFPFEGTPLKLKFQGRRKTAKGESS